MTYSNRVLLTGASGFIGRATASALRDGGWEVSAAGRTKSDDDGIRQLYLDLEDPATILALGKQPRFDAVVHLGARVDLNEQGEVDLLVPNVIATGFLARQAAAWGAYFVYASTAIVHGVRSTRIDAESRVNPDTEYGKSKWLGEQLIDFTGIPRCILRIAGVYGADGPNHLGLNRAIAGAFRGQLPTQVGTGETLRNYVYVNDVAAAILFALQRRLTGTHLVAGSETLSIGEMLQLVCDQFLPGSRPAVQTGGSAPDQVIEPSAELPRTRDFAQAIADIHRELS